MRPPPNSPQHKPGNEQGNEAVPEFKAEQYPPGTAPEENSFRPNPIYETPSQGNVVDYPNFTSKDIYNAQTFESGRPMQGQTSREQRGAHPGKNKKEHSGLEGVGATKGRETVEGVVRNKTADKPQAAKGERGKSGSKEGGLNWPGAEDTEPTRAENI
jgi:hypothetical protein